MALPIKSLVAAATAVLLAANAFAQSATETAADSGNASPIYGVTIPAGYRDWKVISVSQLTGKANQLRVQSMTAVAPVNVQFMVKDSKKYAATAGWGFADFKDGKASDEALHQKCFGCHVPAKDRDYIYTR
jgi:Cytochrome P460